MNSYLDTSALVKLVLDEPGSAVVERLWRASDHVTASCIGHVELGAAVAAACRAGGVPAIAAAVARRSADTVWQQVAAVDLDRETLAVAVELTSRRGLSAADAIHLAAALRARIGETVFVSFDRRLREAAAAEGFRVLPEVA